MDNLTEGISVTQPGWGEVKTTGCSLCNPIELGAPRVWPEPALISVQGLAQSVLSKCLLNEKTDTHPNYPGTGS